MKDKTKQLLAYISKNYAPATVTSLMKLVYLIDLVAIKQGKKQISDFIYRRYRYGPFDSKIYTYLDELINNKILSDITENTPMGEEYIKYKFNEENEKSKFDKLSENELETIDEVIESVRGYGVKTLTEITYKTKPMLALDATIGGEENLNARLDLNAK